MGGATLADNVLAESTTGGAIAVDADASPFGAAAGRAGADSPAGALAEGIGALDAGCGGTSTGAAAPAAEDTGLARAGVGALVLPGSTAEAGWVDAVLAPGGALAGAGFGAGELPAVVFKCGIFAGGDTTVLAEADGADFGGTDGSGNGALLPTAVAALFFLLL